MNPGSAPAPSRARRGVLLFVCSLAVLTYVDRICIAQAESLISREYGLSPTQMGAVFSAFAWGYAIFEVPGGWYGDRVGARKVLTRIVVWWSFFTAATAWAWNYGSLLVIRFLFGAGEAGCFPNVARALKSWFPGEERIRAQSLVWLSARWGGAFTPVLVVWMLELMSWRMLAAILGGLGVLWALAFHRSYRDEPREHPGVDPAERALIEGGRPPDPPPTSTPWAALALSPAVWLICLQYTCLAYAWFFYVTWLPKYVVQGLGVDKGKAALLAALPLFFGGIGCLVSGYVAARVAVWTGSVRSARRFLACTGFAASALLLLLSFRLGNPVAAMVAMGLAGFTNDFVMPVSWAACMDVGGRHVGVLSGLMNTASAVAGGVAPLVTGFLLDRSGGDWSLTFQVSAAVYGLGLVCWLFLDSVTPLERPTGAPA
jgi:MFS family permease